VVLSHENIQANRYQLSARIDFNPSDIVFNPLPVFHSFGLTGGLLLPLLSGIKTFLYPSPLHYRIVPGLVYDSNATILFGTDTFLAGYARRAHPYDFHSLRYVFSGAERVKEETRRAWSAKFGLRVLEGYGATETSPALAINTPMHYKAGTVGRLLPGIRHRLVPVAGIDRGGRLQVSGPSVMLGYLHPERPGEIDPPADGWYDTGDIVDVDGDGYVTILGRAKRFAKIAGEMVSLAAVEGHVSALWSDHNHAVVSVSDSRRGEQLVLVTEFRDADRDTLLAHIRENGGSELMVPKKIMRVDRIPVSGTGKVDHRAVKELVEREIP
jgi:acyl-[acyl-carrier-protein]-phospholipid O-acyltransferase/long-chain-fatty-acid--[acyl-carrier-protein] ligase